MKNTNNNLRWSSRKGFAFSELIIVGAIVALLVALMAGVGVIAKNKAEKLATAQKAIQEANTVVATPSCGKPGLETECLNEQTALVIRTAEKAKKAEEDRTKQLDELAPGITAELNEDGGNADGSNAVAGTVTCDKLCEAEALTKSFRYIMTPDEQLQYEKSKEVGSWLDLPIIKRPLEFINFIIDGAASAWNGVRSLMRSTYNGISNFWKRPPAPEPAPTPVPVIVVPTPAPTPTPTVPAPAPTPAPTVPTCTPSISCINILCKYGGAQELCTETKPNCSVTRYPRGPGCVSRLPSGGAAPNSPE